MKSLDRLSTIETDLSYEAGVYMLTGINGIGKSTIVDAIASDHPEIIPLHASHELSKLFNGVSREEMEALDPTEKLARMVIHFTSIFEQITNEGGAVLLDTHLLVPIRSEQGVRYENIWSDDYTPYASSMVMLTANPTDVRDWRLADERATGRKRSVKIDDIAADQLANTSAFHALKASGSLPSTAQVIENTDGYIEDTRQSIEDIFRTQ